MTRWPAWLAAALMLAVGGSTLAEETAVAPQHRSPESLAATLEALAGPDVDVRVVEGAVRLTGPVEAVTTLHETALALDHPRRSLVLSVRPRTPADGNGTAARRYTTTDGDPLSRVVSVRTVEGRRVSVSRATARRWRDARVTARGRFDLAAETVVPIWLRQGFDARMEIAGSRFIAHVHVTLDDADPEGGAPVRRRLATVISGPLSEWVSMLDRSDAADPSVRRYRTGEDDLPPPLELRVDLADAPASR